MNAGQAITEAMREQRTRDLADLMRGNLRGSLGLSKQDDVMKAWCWWGWPIAKTSRYLGKPGYP